MTNKHNILQVSFLIACGSALQLAETFIPYPIPGIKIGLANLATLIGLLMLGIPAAFEIALFRPVITSLANGTFLAPDFILSFFGSIGGFFVMALVYLSGSRSKLLISMTGNVAHNIMQLLVAYLWLIPSRIVITFAALFIAMSLISGYFIGWAGQYVISKMAEKNIDRFFQLKLNLNDEALNKKSIIWTDKLKIAAAFVMILSTIFWKTYIAYVFLIFIMFAFIVIAKEPISLLFKKLFRLWGVLLFSFLIPIVFHRQG
jgi:heptaprenyl diphosphate synthase